MEKSRTGLTRSDWRLALAAHSARRANECGSKAMTKTVRVCACIAVLMLCGCESASTPVVRMTPGRCLTDMSLAGTWSDVRMTPLGPAWAQFTFGCDCSYRSQIQLLFSRVVERGQFAVGNGELHFQRRSGETNWPYRVTGELLQLVESPKETHQYQQRERFQCAGAL